MFNKIKPFCALRYNQSKISDLSGVICPPYDVISASEQEYYHNQSPYNMIHLILGQDKKGEDRYERAALYLNKWIKEQVLVQEQGPAIYFYNQRFNVKGETKNRLGFIALLRLEDEKHKIFPHEHTRLEPKEDRLRLLRKVRANLSPIFVLFSDHKRIIPRTYEQYLKDAQPIIDVTDVAKVSHTLWKLDAQEWLKQLQAQMNNEHIFIADGHHRYEVALAFRDKIKKRLKHLNNDSDYNYILAYFTNIESRGLTIFPVHRLVRHIKGFKTNKFQEQLKQYFVIQEIKDKDRFFFLMEKAGSREKILGMYIDKKYYLLRLRNVKILDKEIADKPKDCRLLDVSVLNYIIFKKILELDLEDKKKIKFSPHSSQLIKEIDNGKGKMAFFLNPVKIEQLVSIAKGGERMPSKSTYFYPKVPAGLVINKFANTK